MTTVDYLNQVDRLNKMINNKIDEIENLRLIAASIGSIDDGERVKSSISNDKLCNAVSKIIEAENEMNKLVLQYIARKNEIVSQIEQIEKNDYYHVLYKRYVNKKAFHIIADDTGWSLRKVYKMHNDSIVAFEEKFGETYLKNQ